MNATTTPARRPLMRVLMMLAILLSFTALAASGCEEKKDEEAAGGEEKEGAEGAEGAEGEAEAEAEGEAEGSEEPAAAEGDGPERAVLGARATPEIKAEPVTIAHKVAPVGTKWSKTKSDEMAMNLAITMGDKSQTVEMKQAGEEVRTVEVLEVNDVAPTKVKVTYEKHTKNESAGGKEKTEAKPVEGKTYVVAVGDAPNKPTVTLEDGTAPSAEELEVVQKDFKRLGEKEPFAAVVPDGELTPDQKIEITPEALTDMFGADEGMSVESVDMVYKGIHEVDGNPLAAFWIDMAFTGEPQPGMNIDGSLQGYAYLVPDGAWEAGAEVGGDMDMNGDKGEQKMKAAGQMQMTETVDYTMP